MHDSLLHLLRAALPEFIGSLMAAIVLAAAGRGTKTARERLRARRLRDDAASIARPDEEPDHRQAA